MFDFYGDKYAAKFARSHPLYPVISYKEFMLIMTFMKEVRHTLSS
jgi:hypothetical protein